MSRKTCRADPRFPAGSITLTVEIDDWGGYRMCLDPLHLCQ